MMGSQAEKGARFVALHAAEGAFVIPNPWDAGSAHLLTRLGFAALATTSAGLAFSLGLRDGAVSRDAAMANARAIVDATTLPVAADLENGYGDSPQDVAETIRMAGEVAGLVGGSIEDATGNERDPLYSFGHAVERIAAAVEAARALATPFVLVARCENYLHGRQDLDDTILRLQAFEAAGADMLFAPGLTRADDIRTVCTSLTKPVNVLGGLAAPGERPLSVAELASLGVRRISVGSALSRAALGAFLRAAEELKQAGTFDFMAGAIPHAQVQAMMPGA
jgi:2-methylisocitrate lyase-like PEP mutase family enzyme